MPCTRAARVLILTGRKTDVLEQLAAELGDRVEAKPLDLSDGAAVRSFVAESGEVDVLVANAGLPGTGKLTDYTEEQVDRVVDVNLRSPIQMTRALVPGMLERGRGHLVYISSISGKVATAYASLYNATKFGLRGFSFAMHEDLRGTGVGATTVFPGAVADAGMWADGGLDLPTGVKASKPEAVADAVIEGIEKDKPEINVAQPDRAPGRPAGGSCASPRVVHQPPRRRRTSWPRRSRSARPRSARAGRSSGRG